MAHKGVNTFFLWKGRKVGDQGTAGTVLSLPMDLRDVNRQGNLTVSYSVALSGTFNTCGTSVLTYLTCSVFDGSYFAAGTFATFGVSATQGNIAISSPPPVPFMKIRQVSGTSAPIVTTAELHVQ